MGILAVCRVFVIYSWYSYRALFTWLHPGVYLVLKILVPMTQVLFFSLLGRAAGHDPEYFIVGNAVQVAVASGIFGTMQIIATERSLGTLPQLMIVPTNNRITFYGRSILMIVDSLSSVAASLFAGIWLFGLDTTLVNWGMLFTAIIAVCFAVAGLGFLLGTLGLIGTDVNLMLNIALAVLLVLSGANFPIGQLPQGLQLIARGLPITNGLEAARQAFDGTLGNALTLVGREILVGVAYMFAGFALYNRAEKYARRHGRFEIV